MKKKLAISALLTLFFSIHFLFRNTTFVDQFYESGIHTYLFKTHKIIHSIISVSLGDLLYFFGFAFVFRFLYLSIRRKKQTSLSFWIKTLITINTVYLIFLIQWGGLYFKTTKPLISNHKQYSKQELICALKHHINKANSISCTLEGKSFTKDLIISEFYSDTTYSKNNTQFSKIKTSLLGTVLSHMGYSGYINPFTLESHINSTLPLITVPTTVAHEHAHQMGEPFENKANERAFDATITHSSEYVQWSGNLFAIRHLYYTLYQWNKEDAVSAIRELNELSINELKKTNEYWLNYQNPLENLLKNTYDLFLKSNNHKKGISSYNQICKHIVSEFIKKNGCY